MATRNLARTAVEGGKPGGYRYINWCHTRSERQQTRIQLRNIHSVDDALDADATPLRKKQWREFTDQLAPARRFLEARAGQPWDKVHSELCARYDRRTLKGWHLLSTHVFRHMVDHPNQPYRWWSSRRESWVDEHGILRFTPWRRRR